MGCGSSSSTELAHDLSGLSSALNEDSESDGDSNGDDEGAGAASNQVAVPEWMEKLWKVKTQLVDQGSVQALSQATFCKHFGLQTRNCFKALAAFQRCSDKTGRLRPDKFCRMLAWPVDRNRLVTRMVACFDGDADQSMDFREFLMVAAMHFPSGSSNLEKLRYWWWIMLFTDENSFLTSDKTTPMISREDVVKLATGDHLKTGKNAADVCVPLETIGRFLRDLMSSCAGLKIAAGMEVFQYNSNPAPSKLYGKVMNLLLKRGKISFGNFFTFCTKQHTQSCKILVHFYDHLAALLRTAPSPAAVTPQDSLRLRSYFYNKVEEYKDVAKGERAREKSGLSANASEPAPPSSSAALDGGGSYEDKSDSVCNASGRAEGHARASDISDISSEDSDVSDYPEMPSPKTKEVAGLFSEDESPVPQYQTYWNKIASPSPSHARTEKEKGKTSRPQTPTKRPMSLEKKVRRQASDLSEQELELRRSSLSAELDRLDSGIQSLDGY